VNFHQICFCEHEVVKYMSLYSNRSSVFYFNFLVELGWRASLGRFGLDWGLYFKELLGENVGTPSQNKQFSIVLWLFFNKKKSIWT
jgi:hypothetical protein